MLYLTVKARALLLASLLATLSLLAACDQKPQWQTVTYSGNTMGTTYTIKVVVSPEQQHAASKTQQAVDALLKGFNQSLSTYIKDSEIMTINAAPAQQWLTVSPRFLAVLTLSREVSDLSAGAFDATVMPLVNLWGFGPDWHKDAAPSLAQINTVLERVDYRAIAINTADRAIKKLKPVSLDFSAVAKGYGVDEVADFLWQQGFHHFMVEIGGELRVHGHNANGTAWRIGVESPVSGGSIKPIQVSEVGVATSGDYRNYFEQDGVRFSHTIDPVSGQPITHNLASVTVIAESAAKADALATAFSVMGGEAALALAQQEGIAVYIIERAGDRFITRHSAMFEPYFLN
ncbi:FAD:protein FMN transferase [Marinagarivorans algicola]|uniref:FAD:protein FMN transferase n=1 Tax=Marinagarivorans algicola TaxID=1513270 RepID=UPI0006B9FDA5|nr:FAD:protein FMN transferase [Marinagarivorans algicola]